MAKEGCIDGVPRPHETVVDRPVHRIDCHTQVGVGADLPAQLPLAENDEEALSALP